MPQNLHNVAILLVDITGSTSLYERAGDASAARQIIDCIERMKLIAGRGAGTFIRSKGDDLLCTFASPASAMRAVRLMLSQQSLGTLAIHAGVHFGSLLQVHDDLFGDALNLTARLAASAKAGELLASRSFVDQLSEDEAALFRTLDKIAFKGKSDSIEIYSLVEDLRGVKTGVILGNDAASRALIVNLRHRFYAQQLRDRAVVTIGRSPDCDLVIGQPWISRKHATLTIRRDKVQLDDQSSLGTYVTLRGGQELFLRRETLLLTGSGIISPARRPTDAGAEAIHYDIEYLSGGGQRPAVLGT